MDLHDHLERRTGETRDRHMNEGEQSEVVLLRDNRLTQRPAGADDELGELDVLVAEISLRDGDECRKVELRRIDPRERDFVRDRKSTRLNSSHGSISYAVFCLNK